MSSAEPFKPGEDERRGRGGKRKGAGPKPLVIRKLEEDWRSDAKSAADVMNELFRLSLAAGDETVRVTACKAFMDRLVGKPKQQVDVNLKNSDLKDHYTRALAAISSGVLRDPMAHEALPSAKSKSAKKPPKPTKSKR